VPAPDVIVEEVEIQGAAGVPLFALAAGPEDGPLAILLHGFPESGYGWRRQMPALAAAGFRVVAPDQRGYGRSGKPAGVEAYSTSNLSADVLAIAGQLGRDRFCLAGHDWGGIVAWEVAIRYPQRLRALVILNAPHPDVIKRFPAFILRHPSQLLRSWYMIFFQLPWLPERGFAAFNFWWAVRALVWTSRKGTFPASELARYQEAWRQPGAPTGMINWYRALLRKPRSVLSADRRVQVPLRIGWGMRDVYLLPDLCRESLRYCDEAAMIPFAGAGHWLHLEESEAVSRLLVESFTEREGNR
jgi:epoxide hydrolase 4